MKFIIIGITDAPEPWFSPEVLEIIKHGRIFSGGKRHHELVQSLLPEDAEWIDITVPLTNVLKNYELCTMNYELLPVIVFASGDPLFFGFANTLRRELPEAEIEVYPTFNSLQMLAHRLLMPYHDMRIVSLTGRPWPAFDCALIERTPKMGVLTDREHTPAAIARRMMEYGYTNYQMHVGEHLGHPEQERIGTYTLEEAANQTFEHPNCLILTAIGAQQSRPSFGLPDAAFSLLNGREKMITKMPIRLLTLQALDLPHKHTFWDIGFCTGSVSIEARLQFPHLHIVAFEIRPECEAIIQENAHRFGAPGIEVVMGDFLNFSPLTAPDAIFIGGHGGHLKEIMTKCLQYLQPGGCIVMNSVEGANIPQNSHQLFDDACKELGLNPEPPLRVAINDYHPIIILKVKK